MGGSMFTRGERIGQMTLVAIALVFAFAIGNFVFGRAAAPGGIGASPGASATPNSKPPDVTFTQDTCCTQTARYMRAAWTSSEKITAAKVAVAPDPGFPCESSVDATGTKGLMTCQGLLRGATDYTANLALTTSRGTFSFEHKFKTMGDKLSGLTWFTEFEDARGDPLACAAASVRIVEKYTTNNDPLTATQILQQGQAFNKSKDPGLDPVAIATVLQRMEPRNHYHYYRYDTREDATGAAVYWLVRSGKPVMVISLAGQHGPVLIGFQGAYGTYYDDPANRITGVIVEDPQRGDLSPATQNRRPDKYRTAGFQTGQLLSLDEWNRDEWWLGFPYASPIRMPDGSLLAIDRNDGVYPTPHWAGKFVIIVDDGDAENPPDREGRVKFH